MNKKQKETAELGRAIRMTVDSPRFKKMSKENWHQSTTWFEDILFTLLFNHCNIDNETDRKKFVDHVLNLESIK